MKVTPAILTDSFATLQQQANLVKYSSAIEAIHIDVIDGSFLDNITVTPLDLTVGEYEPAKLDFHFMTEEPLDYVYECEGIKDYLPIRRIYGQVERMTHQADFLETIKVNDWQGGLALDLFTSLDAIDEDVWPNLHHLLLMAVEAGAQQQTFHSLVVEKIQEVQKLAQGLPLQILVDGGVSLASAPKVLAAGVNQVAVGSAIWKSTNPLQTIEDLVQLH